MPRMPVVEPVETTDSSGFVIKTSLSVLRRTRDASETQVSSCGRRNFSARRKSSVVSIGINCMIILRHAELGSASMKHCICFIYYNAITDIIIGIK